ncbi:MAG: biotin transporter BioY [Chloroflexota bacterium]|nr:biotin transporter BioY [Chloroflexota bacterium]MEE3250188.1 biotin transporter BioY [Chloroflexota bacterium]
MVAQTGTRSIIDVVIPVDGYYSRISRDVTLIILFTLITAAAARISVHLPFTPVPITGQTLAVLLAGATLGSRRGAAAMVLYAVGGSQFNIFAGGSDAVFHWQAGSSGYILGITSGSSGFLWNLASGGYIVGFIPAAFVVGFLCERGWDTKSWIMVAMLAGNVVLYVPGLVQLSFFVPDNKVMEYGLYPFIAGDMIKLYIAAISVPAAWGLFNLTQERDDDTWI